MSGKRPASMNSDVPMAKIAMASRYSGRGIEELRGERSTRRDISSPRSAPKGAVVRPQNAAGQQSYELSSSGG
jgi:hypothetical protein